MRRSQTSSVDRKQKQVSRQSIAQKMRRAQAEALESRRLLSANVTIFHNDPASDGVNSAEASLTPSNVKLGAFGKLFTTALDGKAYAQPLILTQVTINAGPNTTSGAAGLHDVAFVATENDSLYAIDAGASGGAILWKRSFNDLTPANIGTAAGTNVNNSLNATAIAPVLAADVGINDISPVLGITGTPVIDSKNGVIYLVTFAAETINNTKHFVQVLHAVNLSDGTDKVLPFVIGDTPNTNTNTNNTPIYSYGNGDGSVIDPYNNTGQSVVQFNALRENQRAALSLVNGTLYIAWASHGDNGPYHGWVVSWNVANVLSTGMVLSGVLNTSPNGGEAGIWMGGGALSFEPDGSAFYFETGNGPANGGGTQLNSAGFPSNADYPDAVIRAQLDPTTTATNQGPNGWGIKVVDYFTPYNQPELDNVDEDFGSGQALVLPASAGIAGHPNLLIAAGKQGTIYLLDRNNLGHYSGNSDAAINSVPNGFGQNTPPVLFSGALSAPSYYNGQIYWATGYSGPVDQFSISSTGIITKTGSTPETTFGYLPGSVSISSAGSTGGIVWATDTNTNELHAFAAGSLSTELWNSGQKTGGGDSTGALNKFAAPTIANGEVYVGTASSLVVFGLTPPQSVAPLAPVLSGLTLSSFSVSLSWTDASVSPNLASGYSVQQLINGTYQTITTAPAGATSIDIGGLSTQTTYSFRIQGFNGIGNSPTSNVVALTTSATATAINLASGFANSTPLLTFNGSAKISGPAAQLTDGGTNEAGSVFSSSAFGVQQFKSNFQFQLVGGSADGFTFTLQGNSPTALGSAGGGLGYATDGGAGPTIGNSVAIKFDLYSNGGEGIDSTGIYENGASPILPAIDLTPSGVNLHSGDIFNVAMSYDGNTLTVTILDTVTNAVATQAYTVNIPAYTGAQAYVGFTGGTGGKTTITNILNWTFQPFAVQAPAAPTGLGATPASGSSITLTWTNNATNQTGFLLDRATDSLFTQNLITQTLGGSVSSFTDSVTGLVPGGTYYYRIRANNTAGSSANSNVASATIPQSPAKPTNAIVQNVTATEVDLAWTDNAGRNADGYNVYRATNHGAFTLYAVLPALNASDMEGGPQSTTYGWVDTGVQPGTFYEYHIEAYNIAGYNDFAGTGTTTLTIAPALSAVSGSNTVLLSWLAPTGATAYNLYRGATSGSETLLASNLSGNTFADTTAVNGKSYFYYLTALNGNVAPIPSESAASNEVPANPAPLVPPAAPTALVATTPANATVPQVILSWTGTSGANSYNLYRSTTTGTETLLVTGITSTGYTDNAVVFGTSYFYRVTAVGAGGESVLSLEASATPLAPTLNFSSGFSGSGSKLTYNGSASISGSSAQLTSGIANQAASIFSTAGVDVTHFTTAFAFQFIGGSADGFTFTIEGNGPAALGSAGGGLGYSTDGGVGATIGKSVAIKFDLYSNAGEGNDSTGIYENGAVPTVPAIDLTASGVNLHSGNVFNAAMTYDGTHLVVTITDTVTKASATQTYTVNIPSYTGATANVGFTGGTGGLTTTTNILNWTYTPTQQTAPSAPTGLTGAAVSAAAIQLSWTDGSSNQTGFYLDRATNSTFTANLVTQTLSATAVSFTDSAAGISSGGTYYYRIRAFNSVGTSSNSPAASVTVPVAPSAPAGLTATATANSSSAQIVLNWNSSTGATSYSIYRSQSAGAETTPALVSGVTGTTYTDNSATFGSTYYYKIVAAGVGGSSAFSNEASAKPIAPVVPIPVYNFSSGFVGSTSKLTYNGSAVVSGANAQLTNGTANQAASIFSTTAVDVTHFNTSFQFQFIGGNADGFTFTIEGNGPAALGSAGGGLGYSTDGGVGATIGKSVAIKFDLYSNAGEGNDSTGIYENGAVPTMPAIDLTPSGVNLHSGNVFSAAMSYDGTTLTVTITDTNTKATATQKYTVNIPSYSGSQAYVGFTGGTGGQTTTINILNWTYTPTAAPVPVLPGVPNGLTAVAAVNSSSPSIALNWTAASNGVTYNIYRSTSSGAETAPAIATGITGTSFTDTTGSFGVTYYYEVSAVSSTNTEGALSTEASAKATAPVVTATPLNFGSGFTNTAGKLTFNGSAALSGSNAQLTNGGTNEAGSVFSAAALSVSKFNTSFQFQFIGGNADGFTFTLQGNSPTALGSAGGGLGYGTDGGVGTVIGKSVAIKFDLYSNAGEGGNSTGIYTNGTSPTTNAIDLGSSGINLHSGDIFNAAMSYNGTTLTVVITDTQTKASATQNYVINIAAFAGPTAYVGFTGGTGGQTTTTNILNWVYTPGTT
jgi:fibronectin type 3 domain-containing protein